MNKWRLFASAEDRRHPIDVDESVLPLLTTLAGARTLARENSFLRWTRHTDSCGSRRSWCADLRRSARPWAEWPSRSTPPTGRPNITAAWAAFQQRPHRRPRLP